MDRSKREGAFRGFLKKNTPPGTDFMKIFWLLAIFLVLTCVAAFLIFLSGYLQNRENLYTWYNGEKVLREGMYMIDINRLRNGFAAFFAYIGLCAGQGFGLYRSFRYGSKSIYVMKRLPKDETLRRSFALPCLAVLAAAVMFIILINICVWIYVRFTPPEAVYWPVRLWRFDFLVFVKR